ncbi:hypothetical protein QOZ34_31970, partial [Pseudomonas aeruginosa]|uniref:hypothetical protein n=1 Tax=Pseudomonas aeruginosa TaxID=287 RepID=UPI00345A821B
SLFEPRLFELPLSRKRLALDRLLFPLKRKLRLIASGRLRKLLDFSRCRLQSLPKRNLRFSD